MKGKYPLCRLDGPHHEGRLILCNVNVIDVENGAAHPFEVVEIENGVISYMGKDRGSTGGERVDAEGKYLMPGLWDMHTHLLSNARFAFPALLASGVTGVRDMGTDRTSVIEWNSYRDPMPRLLYAGPIMDGLVDEIVPLARDYVATAEDAVATARVTLNKGADLLKVHNKVPRAAYYAIAEFARSEGVPFSGHVPFEVSAFEAIEAGQSSIEHLSGLPISLSSEEGALRDQVLHAPQVSTAVIMIDIEGLKTMSEEKLNALIKSMKAHNVYTTASLIAYKSMTITWEDEAPKPLNYYPAHIRDEWTMYNSLAKAMPEIEQLFAIINEFLDLHKGLMMKLHRAGIPIMIGTDSVALGGFPGMVMFYGDAVHEEMALMVEAGFTPREALMAATVYPARYLALEDKFGSVSTGKLADLVLLSGNPLEDIKNARHPEAVILGGKYMDRSALESLRPAYPAYAAGG